MFSIGNQGVHSKRPVAANADVLVAEFRREKNRATGHRMS